MDNFFGGKTSVPAVVFPNDSLARGYPDSYPALPLWAAAYGQLDAAFFYKVTDKLSFGLEAQNLNNVTFKQEMEQHMGTHGHSWFVTGARYTAQARYSF